MRDKFLLMYMLVIAITAVAVPSNADKPFIWMDAAAGIMTKAEIPGYLDDLQAHGVTGIRMPIDSRADGTVVYKKTTKSGLPTDAKLKAGQWASDDYLSYMISEASNRGIKVIAVLQGGNDAAWDKNPGWRETDSKGKPVTRRGDMKGFCVNSPYWEKVFFPMISEVGANYDVAGFHFDTSNVAYSSHDSCFCANCKARFEKETGKTLPAKAVSLENQTDPLVKLYASRRVEWLNEFSEKYGAAVREARPGAEVMLSLGDWTNAYDIGLCSRRAGMAATAVSSTPFDITDLFEPVTNEASLMYEDYLPFMTPYGYQEFMTKATRGDAPGKTHIASDIIRPDVKRTTQVQIGLIESAIGAGAKGYCLSDALRTSASSVWKDPVFIKYLKDLTGGERSKWIADMQSDSRVAILYDRDAAFWAGDPGGRFGAVGGVFSILQHWRKSPVSIISSSESVEYSGGDIRYRLDPALMSGFDIVIVPGAEWVSADDLRVLKEFVDGGGKLLLMGGIGGGVQNDAYDILGISTVGKPEPSGYVLPAVQHPVFTVPGGFTGPMGSYRISADKNAAWSYKPKFGDGWEVLANEVTSSGKRESMIIKEIVTGKKESPISNIGYLNADMASAFTPEMQRVLDNMVVVTAVRSTSVVSMLLSDRASVNTFKSSDGRTRYIHVFTPEGEEEEISFRIRPDLGMVPKSAEVITLDGGLKPLKVSQESREPQAMEMTVTGMGNAIIKLSEVKSPFAMIRIQYEKRDDS